MGQESNSRQVQEHKTHRHPLSPYPKQPPIRQIMIHHPSQEHIIESINPQRSQQEQNETWVVCALRSRILDGDAADYKRGGFPDGAHDDRPCEGVTVFARLIDMYCGGEAEEAREEDGGREGGTECPHVLGVVDSC